MSLKSSFYRPEIDGLRTIAVLSVIIYHAEFAFSGGKFLPGGFLGVDVFFVISGFLITSLIIKELNDTGQFSIGRFYERRARRLLPALLLVMFVSSFYAYKYLFASQLTDFIKSIAASLTFVANIYWHVTLQEYGAESGAFKPFLHTWSLAVEEQFYLFFPLIFVFFYKRNVKTTAIGIATITVISLIGAQWASVYHASFSFFELPTRLWELLAGSLLAVISLNKTLIARFTPNSFTSSLTSPALLSWVATLSVLILLGSMFVVTLDDIHPGFVTAIPVFATVIYIACAREQQWVTKMLASKPFVGIGLISYSLYLWHYPIFAFARIRGKIFYTFEDKLLLIAATFVLSIVGYYLIEKTFRNPKRVNLPLFIGTTLCSVGVLAFMLDRYSKADSNERRFEHLVSIYGDAEFDNHKLKNESVILIQSRPEKVRFKENSGKLKIVIVGNSHGKDSYNVFAQNIDLFPGYEFEYIGFGIGAHQQRFFSKTRDHPWFQQADLVVLSNRYMPRTHNYVGDLAVLGDFIDNIRALGKPIVVLSNTAEFDAIDDKLVFDWYIQNHEFFKADELKEVFYQQLKADVEKRINLEVERIAKEKGVLYLDKREYICDDQAKTCDGVTPEGHKAFYDYGHYTLRGAKNFGQKIADTGWFDLSSLDLGPTRPDNAN